MSQSTTTPSEGRRCSHCGRIGPARGYCCDQAELESLRSAVDETLTALDLEIRAPLVVDDGGAIRETVEHLSQVLKQARRVA